MTPTTIKQSTMLKIKVAGKGHHSLWVRMCDDGLVQLIRETSYKEIVFEERRRVEFNSFSGLNVRYGHRLIVVEWRDAGGFKQSYELPVRYFKDRWLLFRTAPNKITFRSLFHE